MIQKVKSLSIEGQAALAEINDNKLIIVSGRSGSGKSIALHFLEDKGYYCVDNLPINLLTKLISKHNLLKQGLACSIDVRNWPNAATKPQNILAAIKQHQGQIWFLDAANDILMQRFIANRRQHPLVITTGDLSLALQQESKLLMFWAEAATHYFDTSDFSERQLHARMQLALTAKKNTPTHVTLVSFGYKFGLPPQAEWIFDLRHFPNPYWDRKLRSLTGLDFAVQEFFLQSEDVSSWLKQLFQWLKVSVLPLHCHKQSIFALGCTGGQHRSVYAVEQLAGLLEQHCYSVSIYHRELKRNTSRYKN